MISDNNQFCFIICTNNKQYLDECAVYISLLEIPEGYTIDLITIEGANSIAEAYNAAMNASPAKYKIYLHHDTMILNRYFLYNILKIFESDDDIGMIGMGGNVHLEDDALLSFDLNKYVGYNYNRSLERYISNKIDDGDYIYDVEAIDGFIMATQYDIPWREDIFDAWDFYDLSQSMEFHRLDYRVVVPDQKGIEWCFHADDMTSTLYEFEKYRKIFREEYGEDLKNYDIERKDKKKNLKREEGSKERISQYVMLSDLSSEFKTEIKRILDLTDEYLRNRDKDGLMRLGAYFEESVTPFAIYRISVDLRRVHHTLVALAKEIEDGITPTFSDMKDIEALKHKYVKCQMMLRRIEMDVPGELMEEAFSYLTRDTVSPYFLGIILSNPYSGFSQIKRIMSEICHKYLECGDVRRAKICIGLFKDNGK
ncbi:hypothetical protein UYO_2226 [Lachnospiraceae bacterium JC7]|nr:hypothetical protein UYO_2226 [Lachnospiraceae bacterium JC7]